MIDLATNASQRRARVSLRLKSESNSDKFERICEEDRGNAGHRSRQKSTHGSFVSFIGNDHSSYLLIGEEFDGGIREDSEQSGRVSTK